MLLQALKTKYTNLVHLGKSVSNLTNILMFQNSQLTPPSSLNIRRLSGSTSAAQSIKLVLKSEHLLSPTRHKSIRNSTKQLSNAKPKIMELTAGVMNYEWGKVGNTSEVARLYKNNEAVTIDDDKPYAELWMGTHPNCPSHIKSTGMDLTCVLQNHPTYLGDESIKTFGMTLPFLFKVLSVNKALSIQVHPDRDHAKQLFKDNPGLYKDPNHKPELAIALTNFKAMCGFRPYKEIQSNFKAMFEIENVIGKDAYETFLAVDNQQTADSILPQCFKNLMVTTNEKMSSALEALVQRIKKNERLSKAHKELYDLVQKLNEQYPNGDVGCFGPIFLNVINLSPGEAVFLGANEIHAYIKGDCVECMASSDNVIRAGLTPKYKDVDTLLKMLNYAGQPHTSKLFKPIKENEFSQLFRPPVPDFAVALTKIPKGKSTSLIPRSVASIAIFVQGYAHTGDDIVCTDGTILFIPANEEVRIVDVEKDIICYVGMANV